MGDSVTRSSIHHRYGQDEIAAMLRARGARESAEGERRSALAPGEEHPPWVRRSSRRERDNT